jgi:hypothetical protein
VIHLIFLHVIFLRLHSAEHRTIEQVHCHDCKEP